MQFQSLSGFQVRCNLTDLASGYNNLFMFQSLSGFQVRCNHIHPYKDTTDDIVSIPIGFSSSLQRPSQDALQHRQERVSIPIGFSSSLQHIFSISNQYHLICFNPYRVFKFVATVTLDGINSKTKGFQSLSGFQVRCNTYSAHRFYENIIRFQSLSGFQVRCNCAISGEVFPACSVSIPIGFSSSLQHISFLFPISTISFVSIPIGFSSSLQLKGCVLSSSGSTGFNPYRVFKFVATGPGQNMIAAAVGFQSLSGFQVRCN